MIPSISAFPAILFLIFIFVLSTSMLFAKGQRDDRKRPPGPMSLPIIGNLHMLLGELPHRSLQSLAQKYGPIMSLKLGQVPAIVVSSAEAAELFLKTHDTVFASRPKIQAVDPLSRGTRGLAFAEYGSYWRHVRKVCTLHLLSASRVKMLAPLRSEEVGLMVKSLESVAAAREVVNLSEVVGDLIENIINRMILGCAKDDRFNLKGLVEEALSLAGQFNLVDYVPWLGILDLQGLTRKLKRNIMALDDVLEKIVREHEQARREQNGQNHVDFVHIMLSLIHQPTDLYDDQNSVIDRDHLKAILADMIFAATDTSVIVVDWALSELLRHPRVIKNLQSELQNVVGMNRMVDEADLAELSYLDMVIKETLRLHPPAPLLVPRESMKDVTVNGYYIRKRSRIMINAWAIGRDPKLWSDDAYMFYPERFIDNNIDIHGHNYQFLPFGSGRRRCPGLQMGITTVKLVVAQLVHCFSWELPCGMCPSDLDMNEKFGLTVPRMKHLHAVPTYRLATGYSN
ncbi:cytochrome P450 CYP736A12-like [Neltuma alba]|uniref:cytochrome P450 CYP736A12-like n=1 Tax=Neltuma alba TaxID=207710 RepID=UPI0010A44CFE|nr:cytochrome P450 CYP736A12-like [Prosopis alba]